jgi:hypothetical protein
MPRTIEEWSTLGATAQAANVFFQLEAAGAAGLSGVTDLTLARFPERYYPRVTYMDREDVEMATHWVQVGMGLSGPLCGSAGLLSDDNAYPSEGKLVSPGTGVGGSLLPRVVRVPSQHFICLDHCNAGFTSIAFILLALYAACSIIALQEYWRRGGREEVATLVPNAACTLLMPPEWSPLFRCFPRSNVTVLSLPDYLGSLKALGAAVESDGGALTHKSHWAAASVCSPVLKATGYFLPSLSFGILSLVLAPDFSVWWGVSTAVATLLLGLLIYLARDFRGRALAAWPLLRESAQAAAPFVQLLQYMQQLLSPEAAALHMVSYSWSCKKASQLARFLPLVLPDCWVDVARLPHTEDIPQQTVAQAIHCRTLLLLVDKCYLRSPACARELAAAIMHRRASSGRLTAALIIEGEGDRGAPGPVNWEEIKVALTSAGIFVASTPLDLHTWVVSRSLSGFPAQEALNWFKGSGRSSANSTSEAGKAALKVVSTLTMQHRVCCGIAGLTLATALCGVCCEMGGERRRLVAGAKALSADGATRGHAWAVQGGAGLLLRFLLLCLVTAYCAADALLIIRQGASVVREAKDQFLEVGMSYFASFFSAASLFAGSLGALVYALAALWTADPRLQSDPVLRPLILAAVFDDEGAQGQGRGAVAATPIFRVRIAVDTSRGPSQCSNTSLLAGVRNMRDFLHQDIGVRTEQVSIAEALTDSKQNEPQVLTVFILTSPESRALWEMRSNVHARKCQVVAICPCNAAGMTPLYVGTCHQNAAGQCSGPAPTFARDLAQAISCKVTNALLRSPPQ